jgi:hypothetical protein
MAPGRCPPPRRVLPARSPAPVTETTDAEPTVPPSDGGASRGGVVDVTLYLGPIGASRR